MGTPVEQRVARMASVLRIVPVQADPDVLSLYGYKHWILNSSEAKRVLRAVCLKFGIQGYEMEAHMALALDILGDRAEAKNG
jgi:hypothetical protein